MTTNEFKPDRNSPKAYWTPNYRADRITYLVFVVLAIALPLIFE